MDAYHVSFQNQRAGSRIYGMLSVPARPGRYPAMLVVPGAGVRPYFPSIATARRGVIHLAIGIHGIPVDRDSLLYNELRASALQTYWTYGIEDRDRYYYNRVFVGVLRAGDFIYSLPQFDGTNYVVQGGSQGGGLANSKYSQASICGASGQGTYGVGTGKGQGGGLLKPQIGVQITHFEQGLDQGKMPHGAHALGRRVSAWLGSGDPDGSGLRHGRSGGGDQRVNYTTSVLSISPPSART